MYTNDTNSTLFTLIYASNTWPRKQNSAFKSYFEATYTPQNTIIFVSDMYQNASRKRMFGGRWSLIPTQIKKMFARSCLNHCAVVPLRRSATVKSWYYYSTDYSGIKDDWPP